MSAQSLLIDVLDRHIRDTCICFRVNGQRFPVGRGSGHNVSSADITVRVCDPRFFSRVLAAGNLGLGEAYLNHEFEMESGSLDEFLLVLLRNGLDREIRLSPAVAMRVLWTRLVDGFCGKENNIHRHYDAGDEIVRTFLDSNLIYSCGYVIDPDDDLEQLQINKLERICQKLRLEPGHKLLDIGCGYGGLLIYAAKNHGVVGHGVTLSQHHCEYGNQRIADEGLKGLIDIHYADFNSIAGKYDKVVSVGMMEHVPRRQYDRYFARIADVLTADGLGLVHTLGANAPRNRHDPFVQKYIFPNSNMPKLSEIAAGLEKHGLAILDVENMIRHYGYTMKHWQERFCRQRKKLDPARYPDRFIRMWEYYLGCGVAAAFASDSALFQVLFTKDYAAQFPLQRV